MGNETAAKCLKFRERVTGVEPATLCLASTRSSQLSYTRRARKPCSFSLSEGQPALPRPGPRALLRAAPHRHRPSAAGELDRDRPVRVDVQVYAAADAGPLDVDGDGGDVPRRQVDTLEPRNARHGTPGPVLAGVDERRGEVATGERAAAELRGRRDRVAGAEPVRERVDGALGVAAPS